jgi:hypothetical protein
MIYNDIKLCTNIKEGRMATEHLAMIREPLDSVHDFFKGRCTARNDANDPNSGKHRLVDFDGTKYVFNINSMENNISLQLPTQYASFKNKANELLDRMTSNPPRKLNSVEDDTLELYESILPDIIDTAQIDLDDWKGKNNLEQLSTVLLTQEEIDAGIGIGVIVDCGMKPRFSDNFESIENKIDPTKSLVRYYNLHLVCTDWDEAPKTSKNVYKVDIIPKSNQKGTHIDVYGCGTSFNMKSLEEFKDNLEEVAGKYGGAIDLEHLNVNNIIVRVPQLTDADFHVPLPHSLLKTKSLKLSVPHMCQSVYRGTLAGSFFDPNKFEKNFSKNKHEYINTVRTSAKKLSQNFFNDYNLRNNNLFFNLKRSMDAGQVEMTNWLNRNVGKYTLIVTEAQGSKSNALHSLSKSKAKILDPRTLQDIIINNKILPQHEDIDKAVIEPGKHNSNKIIPRLDKFVLFTCDRLCYLKAKLMKVPAVYVNAAMNQIRVFQGITKSKDEIFVEAVRSLSRFFYDDNDYDVKRESFLRYYDAHIDFDVSGVASPLTKELDELKQSTFVDIVTANYSRIGLTSPDRSLFDAPDRIGKTLEYLATVSSDVVENFNVIANALLNGLPSQKTEFTNTMKLIGNIDETTFAKFMEIVKRYYVNVDNNKKHLEKLDEVSLVMLAKYPMDQAFFFEHLPNIKKIQRYLSLPLQYSPDVAIYPNDVATVNLVSQNMINVSYNMTCNFEPSAKRRKFTYTLPTFNQLLIYLGQGLNLNMMTVIESVYNIFAVELRDSDIPKDCKNVSTGLDCLRALRSIYLTFNMRGRSAHAEFEKALELTNLLEKSLVQSIQSIQELGQEMREKYDVMQIGGMRNRGRGDYRFGTPATTITYAEYEHQKYKEERRAELKKKGQQARETLIVNLRAQSDFLEIPEELSLQDDTIATLRIIDSAIGHVRDIFDVFSVADIMRDIRIQLSQPENNLRFKPDFSLDYKDFYYHASFTEPSNKILTLLKCIGNVLMQYIDISFTNENVPQISRLASAVIYQLTGDNIDITVDDVHDFLSIVQSLFINSPISRDVYSVFSGETENEDDEHFKFIACLAATLACSLQRGNNDVLLQNAMRYTYILFEDPILRFLLCYTMNEKMILSQRVDTLMEQQGGNNRFDSLLQYHKRYYPTYARLYYGK